LGSAVRVRYTPFNPFFNSKNTRKETTFLVVSIRELPDNTQKELF
jgi:hypothetical protein